MLALCSKKNFNYSNWLFEHLKSDYNDPYDDFTDFLNLLFIIKSIYLKLGTLKIILGLWHINYVYCIQTPRQNITKKSK